jgi:peptide/nickel transport system substrate-binding protein
LEQAVVEDLQTAEAADDLYVITRPALNTAYLSFNYKIEEFKDKNVRLAVEYALDKAGLVENFYGEYGEVATNFLPPLIWGHNDALEDRGYDPDYAKELLAEAGFPDGLSEVTIAEDIVDLEGNVLYAEGDKIPLKLYYMPVTRFYYPSPEEIGEAMAANLNAAGIEAELYLEGDWPTYLASRTDGLLVGLYMLGWGGDNGDPDNFLGYFFGAGEEPMPKEGWYQNAELAQLLKDAAVATSREDREAMYEQAEQMLYDDVARVWVAHNNTPLIFSSNVDGYIAQPVGADYFEFVEFVD